MKYDTDHAKWDAATCCDSEEIINRVEVAFGIELMAAEIERMVTVGDLHAAVLARLGPGLGDGCVSQAAFQRLRRVLMEHYGAARGAVRPEGRLLELAPALGPPRTRRREWKALSGRLGCHLPELGLSSIESRVLFFIALPCLAPAVWNLWLIPPLLIAMRIAWLGMVKLLNWLAPSRFVLIPQECATVAGLVRTIAERNYGGIARERGFRNEGEVWKILAGIMIDSSGAKPEAIRKEARLREDLKID